MSFEVQKSFLRNRLLREFLGTKVDCRQKMMGSTFHWLVGQSFRFPERTEIEDAYDVELLVQTPQVFRRSVMEMRGSQDTVGPDGASSGSCYAAQIAGVDYVVKSYFHFLN